MKPWSKKLIVRAVLCSMTVVGGSMPVITPMHALASVSSTDYQAAFDVMQSLGIVHSLPDGPHLERTLTRADVAVLLVRAFGQDEKAQLLIGAPSFPDTADGWFSGYAALVHHNQWMDALPDGNFHPEQVMTVGEFIQTLDKTMGVTVNSPTPYPNNVIQAALDAGILAPNVDAVTVADNNLTMGMACYLANFAFMAPVLSGKNVYQTHFNVPDPTIVMNALQPLTTDTTVTVSGTVAGAKTLTVDGNPVAMAVDGTFSVPIPLQVGLNTIKVVATNLVGTSTEQNVLVTRMDLALAPVITLVPLPSTTPESSITVSGTVIGASSVTVNNVPVPTDSAGAFTTSVQLQPGVNVISVLAVSPTGIPAVQTVNITRTEGTGATLTALPSVSVQAGKTVDLNVAAKDLSGNSIPLTNASINFSCTPADLGTFDATTGVFTAGHKAQTGSITLSAGSTPITVQVSITASELHDVVVTGPGHIINGSEQHFQATGQDQYGNSVDLGNNVAWSITPASAGTIHNDGTLVATSPGPLTVKASSGGISGNLAVMVDSGVILPPAPTNLRTSSTTLTETTLSWDAVPTATGYNVYETGKSAPIATNVTSTTYHVKGLVPGTKYSFRVSAVNAAGESTPSSDVSTTTLANHESNGNGNGNFNTVVFQQTVDSTGGSHSLTFGNTKVDIQFPSGAFTVPETVTITTDNLSRIRDWVSGFSLTNIPLLFGVNFSGPAPVHPITVLIQSPGITPHYVVYKVTSTGNLIPVPSEASTGKIQINFSADPNFVVVDLKASQRVITLPNHVGVVPSLVQSDAGHPTTYLPIWYVMQLLQSTGIRSQWDGHNWRLTTPQAAHLSRTSSDTGAMGIYVNGTLVKNVKGYYAVDPYSGQHTTYMPIWYVMQVLNQLNLQSSWNGTTWSITSNTSSTS